MLLLPNNNWQQQEDDTLELEIGQIVYWENPDDENSELVKAEVIRADVDTNRVKILPLPSDESGLIRVPIWVLSDDISLEDDTLFLG
jgi:hypothetical protein